VIEVINLPVPNATVKLSNPVVHNATALGTR